MVKIFIRRSKKEDSREFLGLVEALAKFEKLNPPDKSARRRLIRDIYIKKRLNLFVACVDQNLVGYALYYFSYSSFLAKPTLYLEDLFVLEGYRKLGVGRRLFARCVKEAANMKCGRMEWAVLTWNKNAVDFYENMGAKRLDEWRTYRLEEATIKSLTKSMLEDD
ncbi:MAG: GNAT family N-acetyltransferase [Nitrososphaerota archaeon]|jgi:GNAT superfamily N-acetyltransferase|nr:GNAT family N-acetyltransferase [Nitrososphaerota archaeon]